MGSKPYTPQQDSEIIKILSEGGKIVPRFNSKRILGGANNER